MASRKKEVMQDNPQFLSKRWSESKDSIEVKGEKNETFNENDVSVFGDYFHGNSV
jgi:hypothetical protein